MAQSDYSEYMKALEKSCQIIPLTRIFTKKNTLPHINRLIKKSIKARFTGS